MSENKSFTLIELLIVIGILAILVAAVVVVLNPAQLLAQARDSKRQQDLSALNQALNTVYALDQTISFGTSSIVYTSLPDSSSTCGSWGLPSLPTGWTYNCVPTSTLQNTNGTGWIPVNFQSNGVVNLSSLPTDPVNSSSTGLYYTYVTGGSFQLASHFESSKFQATEGSDAMYTVGSNINLAPFLSGLVGWWKLENNSIDYSNYGYNGTDYGVTYSGTYGLFNGSSYVDVGIPTQTNFGSGDFSISLWMNPTTWAATAGLVDRTQDVWTVYKNGGSNAIAMRLSTGATDFYSSTNISTGVWQYWTAVKSGSTLSWFFNGVFNTSMNNPAPVNSYPFNLFIGKAQTWNSCFNGWMKDVRIYNRALSASEIQALYNATK